MMSDRSKMSNVFEIADEQLIKNFIEGSDRLLASKQLRLELTGTISQLMAHSGEQIATVQLQQQPKRLLVRKTSSFAQIIDRLARQQNFVNLGDANRAGFTEYKQCPVPAGYRMWHTDPAILWKKWWPTEKFQDKQRFNLEILVNFKDNWYPVQNIVVNAGVFTIKTIAGQLVLKRDSQVLWLDAVPASTTAATTVDLNRDDRSSATDLVDKIHQKKSELNPDRVWDMIKGLEQKLQEQIKSTAELAEKYDRAEQRAVVAEQRLQMIYRYFQQHGINPSDVYTSKAPANS